MNPLEHLPLLVPKVEPDDGIGIVDIRKSCFICLTDTSISNDNDRQGKCISSSVRILTSYILHNPLSSSSDVHEREELQTSILSSLRHGQSSICSECLSTAENLMEIHGKLEKIQKEILNVLRNLQATLETGWTSQVQIVQNDDMWLCRFRNMLAEKFSNCDEREVQVRLERLAAAGFRIFLPHLSLPKNLKTGSVESSPEKANAKNEIQSSNIIEHDILEAKIEIDLTKICFLCSNSNDICSNRPHGNDNYPKSFNSIKIMISHLLKNPSSTSILSMTDYVGSEREELQIKILASLKDGKLLICSKCLSIADAILKHYLELDNLQIRILETLRNFQDYVNNSTGGGAVEMRDNVDVTLSISDFQDVLLQEFLNRELSYGTQTDLAITLNSSTPFPVNDPRQIALNQNAVDQVEVDSNKGNETPDIKVETDLTEGELVSSESEAEGSSSNSSSRSQKYEDFFINENDSDSDDDGTGSTNSPKVHSSSRLQPRSPKPGHESESECSESDNDNNDDNSGNGNNEDDETGTVDHSTRMDEYLESLETDGDPAHVPHDDPSLWDCDICLEKVPREEIKHHLQTHPEFEQFYQCDICFDSDSKRTYGTYKGLIWHYLRLEHNIHMTCKLCPEKDVTYYRRTALCRHLYEHHY